MDEEDDDYDLDRDDDYDDEKPDCPCGYYCLDCLGMSWINFM